MITSSLQRFILKESLPGGEVKRSAFLRYYKDRTGMSKKTQIDDVTSSLERLVDKGLLTAYGRWSSGRWYIEKVALTPEGKKVSWQIAKRQTPLPLFKR